MTDPDITRRLSVLERDNADMRIALEAVGYYQEDGDYWRIGEYKAGEGKFAQGFRDGLMEAARVLHEASDDHRNQARECKKVLEAQAHELGAAVLGSWANGLEINANRSLSARQDSQHDH